MIALLGTVVECIFRCFEKRRDVIQRRVRQEECIFRTMCFAVHTITSHSFASVDEVQERSKLQRLRRLHRACINLLGDVVCIQQVCISMVFLPCPALLVLRGLQERVVFSSTLPYVLSWGTQQPPVKEHARINRQGTGSHNCAARAALFGPCVPAPRALRPFPLGVGVICDG